MKRNFKPLAKICIFFLLLPIFLFSEGKEEKQKPKTPSKESSEKISEALGYRIGKYLENLKMPYHPSSFAKGIREGYEGKKSPMKEEELDTALLCLKQKAWAEFSQKKQKEAAAFLKRNRLSTGIVEKEKGKLQYLIVKKGKGESVQKYSSPLLRWKAKLLDGSLSSSFEGTMPLEEAIEGLKKGIEGMKMGEVRKLFIHPDLAYGEQNPELLCFEVEILKPNPPPEKMSTSSKNSKKRPAKIAEPGCLR